MFISPQIVHTDYNITTGFDGNVTSYVLTSNNDAPSRSLSMDFKFAYPLALSSVTFVIWHSGEECANNKKACTAAWQGLEGLELNIGGNSCSTV